MSCPVLSNSSQGANISSSSLSEGSSACITLTEAVSDASTVVHVSVALPRRYES